jgi:tetratricopeptide (TPR) repeat protein
MNNRRVFTSLTLSLITAACATSGLMSFGTGGGAGYASAATRSKSVSSRVSATKLDAKALQLANRGKWADFVEHLQSLTETEQSPTFNHAWLAFGLMFLDKQADLASFAQKVAAMPASASEGNSQKLVEFFNVVAQKKYDEANKLIEAIPDSGDSVIDDVARAALAAKTGNAQKAVDYLQKSVAIAPDFAWGYRTAGFLQERLLKNPDAAEDAYEKALAVQPEFKEVNDLLVDLRVSHNDFDGAIDAAEAAIKANPREATNYYRLSQVLTQQWRLREADMQLDKAIRLAPDNARYHRAKASIMRFEKRMAEAIAEQQKAVDLSTDKAFELTELAALNELAGNDSAAADNLKEALKLAPARQAAYQSAQQKLVQLLTRGKRFDDLVAEYKRALQVQPDNSTLRLGLADALLQLGKTDEALKELSDVANLDQRDPRAHRMTGSILMQKKDYTGAVKAYTRALNINPSSVDDLVALGYSYALNDDYQQAETAFVTALALQQLTNAQGNRAAVMRSFATLLLSEGRYNEATLNYEEVGKELKNSPTEKQDAFLLAQAKALRDRTNFDVQNLLKAFDGLPDTEKSLARSAFIDSLLKLGKTDMALEQLGKAPAEAQTTAQWLTLEARAYRMKGDMSKALEYANKAIATKDESNENLAEAYIELGQAMMAKGDLAAAETALHKATDINNKSFTAYEALGRVFLKRKDFDHALEAAKRSTDINPYHTQAWLLDGDAYMANNKNDLALTSYKRAVELYPSLAEAHRSLRDAYKKLARKDDASKEDETIAHLDDILK